jgi:type I restriction-modification system DNA methylase subunit
VSAARHDSTLSKEDRSRLGAHYTPSAWARRIVARALVPVMGSQLHVKGTPSEMILRMLVIDPACGDGIFLSAAADVLGALLFQAYQLEGQDIGLLESRRLVIERCLLGVDLDPGAIAAARHELGKSAQLTCADALLDWQCDTQGRPTAFVGNPPYLGGRKISTLRGTEYARRLAARYPAWHGNADLCVYFLHLAAAALKAGGSVGTMSYVVTKTIAEGDTRRAGLGALVADGWVIYGADRCLKWPGAANVMVSIVHLMSGELDAQLKQEAA